MTLPSAQARADRLAADTGRPVYVVGNGLGHYWTTDTLAVIPMSGVRQVPVYVAAPASWFADHAVTPEVH